MTNIKIARRQLDKRFAQMGSKVVFTRPRSGWIRAIRESLGMTAAQLGDQIGISKQAVLNTEDNEARDATTLKTLQRMASAMDCTVYYAIVPNKSLEQAVQARAHEVATEEINKANQTMTLEDQALPAEDRQAQIDDLADELVKHNGRVLWRRPA
jgi:predicted DNA-binding mobile mystery protein A